MDFKTWADKEKKRSETVKRRRGKEKFCGQENKGRKIEYKRK